MPTPFDHLTPEFIKKGIARFTEQGDRLTPFTPVEVQMRETLHQALSNSLARMAAQAHAA